MNKNHKIKDELKFRELIKSPIRLFGWIFPYYFVLILILGIYFGHHLITISFNDQNVGIQDSTNIKKEIVEKKGAVPTLTGLAVDMNTVKNPTIEMITKGKELFEKNCKSCHGETGMGDGPTSASLNPKPRNFHQIEGWTNGRTIDAMYKTLQEGISKNGMPSYEYISPSDRFNIIHYIRTLANFPEITDNQLKKLNETYNLSVNTITPNQITINKAEEIIVKENNSLTEKIAVIKEKIKFADDKSGGAKLFKIYCFDLEKAIKTFLSIPDLSLKKFIVVINASPHSLGYKPSISKLNREEWEMLYDYLMQINR